MEWQTLTLFLYITARVSGFILFNPLLGRNNIPGIVRAGLVLVISVFTASIVTQTATVEVPNSIMVFAVRVLVELLVGFMLGMIVNFFLVIPQLAGQVIDTQMGMTMNQIYDASSNANMSTTSVLLNALMVLLFFVGNGHHTLFRLLITSGDLVPFGGMVLDFEIMTSALLAIFVEAVILAVKLAMPILAAELIGQVGMGILMKVIPQINVFTINIDIKILIGLVMLLMLVSPISEFLLEAEAIMLDRMEEALRLTGGG